ncbi:MAG: hypothetical protein Q8J71_05965 [Brevundimonas sp.]|nr:hypothetical protein [Brevundimonas sp.]
MTTAHSMSGVRPASIVDGVLTLVRSLNSLPPDAPRASPMFGDPRGADRGIGRCTGAVFG